jgi:biopolymer transport protein ExbD
VVHLDGKKMKISQVSAQLQKAFKRRPDRTVYIQAYGALSFDIVASVIDAAKSAGAKPIGLVASTN